MDTIFFFGVVIIVMYFILPNLRRWSLQFRQYMFDQSKKVFGHGCGWNRSWGLWISTTLILFFVLLFLAFIYDTFFQ